MPPGRSRASAGTMSDPILRRRRRLAALTGGLLGLLVLVVLGVAIAASQFAQPGRIARNVTIEGVAVAGLTPEEAVSRVMAEWVRHLPQEIGLAAGSDKWMLSPQELGSKLLLQQAGAQAMQVGRRGGLLERTRERLVTWWQTHQVRVECAIDEAKLTERLVELTQEVDRQPQNATVKVEGDEVTPIAGKKGRRLDLERTKQVLLAALQDPTTSLVPLVVEEQAPTITVDDLKHFDTVLASYTTRYNTGQKNRSHNIELAVKALDRTVVKPGEVFSLNEVLGPRQPEFGYKDAVTFIRGEISSSSGGGVCQISSTVYNGALLANMEMIRRSHHSMPVHYVPMGRDATVFYGQIDLQFKNSLTHPVLILASAAKGELTVEFLGYHEDDYEVEILRSGVSVLPFETKETEDPELEEGKREVDKKGRKGYRVTVTRVVKKDGEEVGRQRLHTDTYRPQAEEVRVGAKGKEEALPEPPSAREGAPPPSGPDVSVPPSD